LNGRGQASDPTVKIEESVIKVLNGENDSDREVQLEMEQQRREQEYNNYKRYACKMELLLHCVTF